MNGARSAALALAERGLDVCCVGRRLEPLHQTVGKAGGRSRAVAADIGTDEGIAAVAGAVAGSAVHALVHAAAIEGIASLQETSRATFDRLIATNLAAAIVHLALDATYSTGSVVTVDGGYSAR
jgi:short-subunit dehydrogenase